MLLKGKRIIVKGAASGIGLTPMIERLAREGKIGVARLERRTPLGRIATVEDVARAAAFLLSDSSSYITGVVLSGGWRLGRLWGPGDVATA